MARILVIEDNPANLELMSYLIEAFGHTVLPASDGASGLAAALRDRPDMIVCDVQLPDIDGYTIARRLKGDPASRAIPLVAVTALVMAGDRAQILAAGFDEYIAKPIVPETFVEQLAALLEPDRHAALASSPAPGPPDPRAPARTRATILVVDDSPLNHELMCSILEPFGYTVLTASGVREALALAREAAPHLIVSDLHMPEQDGFALIRALKADPLLRPIKILIHSATVQSELDRREALRLGAMRFITRPLEPQLILAEIERCLNAHPEHDSGDNPHS